MAISVLQTRASTPASSATWTLQFSSPCTPGSVLIVLAQVTASRTFTVTDDVNGAHAAAKSYTGGYHGVIAWVANTASTAVTCSVGLNTARGGFLSILEVAGLNTTAPVVATGELNDATSSTSHYCTDAAGIDTVGNVLAVSCGLLTDNPTGGCQAGADHVQVYTGASTDRHMSQFYPATGGAVLTDYRAPWSHASANSTAQGFCAVFNEAAAGTGQPLSKRHGGVLHASGASPLGSRRW